MNISCTLGPFTVPLLVLVLLLGRCRHSTTTLPPDLLISSHRYGERRRISQHMHRILWCTFSSWHSLQLTLFAHGEQHAACDTPS
jgi:hypothetical protein